MYVVQVKSSKGTGGRWTTLPGGSNGRGFRSKADAERMKEHMRKTLIYNKVKGAGERVVWKQPRRSSTRSFMDYL